MTTRAVLAIAIALGCVAAVSILLIVALLMRAGAPTPVPGVVAGIAAAAMFAATMHALMKHDEDGD